MIKGGKNSKQNLAVRKKSISKTTQTSNWLFIRKNWYEYDNYIKDTKMTNNDTLLLKLKKKNIFDWRILKKKLQCAIHCFIHILILDFAQLQRIKKWGATTVNYYSVNSENKV